MQGFSKWGTLKMFEVLENDYSMAVITSDITKLYFIFRTNFLIWSHKH